MSDLYKSDKDITDEMRDPFYKLWTKYREQCADDNRVADITDCRTFFVGGWESKPVARLVQILPANDFPGGF